MRSLEGKNSFSFVFCIHKFCVLSIANSPVKKKKIERIIPRSTTINISFGIGDSATEFNLNKVSSGEQLKYLLSN